MTFLDCGDPLDQVLVKHSHQPTVLIVAGGDLPDEVSMKSLHQPTVLIVAGGDLPDEVSVKSLHQPTVLVVAGGELLDEISVHDAHQPASLVVAGARLAPYCRKLTSHLVSQLQDLRFEATHSVRQLFEKRHPLLQLIYPRAKRFA
jgi:hypothetical protein